jgi:hypothetical protein
MEESEILPGLIAVPVRAGEFNEVQGLQFTMNMRGLEFEGIESGALDVSFNNVGILGNELMTMSWNSNQGVNVSQGEVLFTLKLNAKQSGLLSRMIGMSSDVTTAEIYTGEELAISDLKLTFNGGEQAVFELYQNEPNPFTDLTVIGFTLPRDNVYTLKIFDLTGKLLRTIRGEGEEGYNSVQLQKNDLVSGVLYYQLDSGDDTATMKMILIQ